MLTPKQIEARIDQAWMVALAQGAFSLLAVVFVILGDDSVFTSPEVPSVLISTGLVLLAALGVYRRSRAGAVVLCLALLANVGFKLVAYGPPHGLLAGLAFGFFYLRGTHAIFLSHRMEERTNGLQGTLGCP